MAEPPVPSRSSSLSREWTLRVIHLQTQSSHWKPVPPKSMNAVTFCPSTMTGALLDHPTRWTIGSGFKNGTARVTSHRPVCQTVFILASLGLGFWWECEGAYCCLGQLLLGVSCIPLVPLGWIKADTGVGHSLAMWPQHLKHWRESGSWWPAAPSPLSLGLQITLITAQAPCAFYPTLCGQTAGQNHLVRATPTITGVWMTRGAPPTASPICGYISRDYLMHWWDCCPIWSGSGQPWIGQSVVPAWPFPSLGSVVTVALALTLSQVSSLSLSAFWVATISYEYQIPGLLYKYQTES